MANCYDNLIGVRGYCDNVTPTSRIYLNDLTGMDMATLDSGVNAEANTAAQLILNKMDAAFLMMLNDARQAMSSRWLNVSSLAQNVLGRYDDELTALAAKNVFRGVGVRLYENDYVEVNLSAVTLLVNYTGNVNVLVVDLRTGQTLDTITVACVANTPVRVTANKTYKSNGQILNLAFIYNATSVPSYQTSLFEGLGCNSCERSVRGVNRYAYERSLEIPAASAKVEQNIKTGTYTGGLSVDYSIQCSFESFICSQMSALAYPFAYKVAALLMKEMQFSKRLNGIILTSRERHEELYNYYESEYNQAMHNYFTSAQFASGSCFACNQRIRQRVAIP